MLIIDPCGTHSCFSPPLGVMFSVPSLNLWKPRAGLLMTRSLLFLTLGRARGFLSAVGLQGAMVIGCDGRVGQLILTLAGCGSVGRRSKKRRGDALRALGPALARSDSESTSALKIDN